MTEPRREAGGNAYSGESPFAPAHRTPILNRVAPVTEAVSGYRPSTAGRDLLAAVTVSAVAIPAAMGYAEVAGLSPVNGLYALMLPTVAYALLGSSRQLVVGPDGAVSALVGAVVVANAAAGGAEAESVAATARAARGRMLPDRARRAARMGGRLPVAAGARRLHPRRSRPR